VNETSKPARKVRRGGPEKTTGMRNEQKDSGGTDHVDYEAPSSVSLEDQTSGTDFMERENVR